MKTLNQSNSTSSTISSVFLLLFIASITVLICFGLYLCDNKYTSSGPQASNGIINISEKDLEDNPVIILVDGWEYYKGVLLKPDNFQDPQLLPDEYCYIGQYGGFEGGGTNDSTHGSGTYRLKLNLPQTEHSYTLELPEIFSSYNAYINKDIVAQTGNPDPDNYKAQTKNKTVTFKGNQDVEIIIAVSDFSHFYSGFVYPPAFGISDSVNKVLSLRFLLRALVCSIAVTIGMLSIIIGFLSRFNFQALLYGILCLFFTGYVSYPIIKAYLSAYYPFYALENLSFCVTLFLVVLLGQKICQIKKKLALPAVIFSLFICFICIIIHFILPQGVNTTILYGYSYLITIFEWIVAIYLSISTIFAVTRNNISAQPLLTGIVVFDITLVMDRLLPLYEPIVGGWFPELGSLFLILMIGYTTAKSIAEQYKKNAVLEERTQNMRRLLLMQKTYYPMIQEKINEAKTARHDLRHHLVTISGYLANKKYESLENYFSNYKTTLQNDEQIIYSNHEVMDMLSHYYINLTKQKNIDLSIKLDVNADLKISDEDISSLFSNLLENAVESCLRANENKPFITLTAKSKAGIMSIHMENSCDSINKNKSKLLSSKKTHRTGYGLESIKSIADKYNGSTEFYFEDDKRIFISVITLEA